MPENPGADVLEIASDADVVRVRQAVRTRAVDAKFSIVDQTKLVTAASELARNTLVHGRGGHAEITQLLEEGRRGIRVKFKDEGPGIEDLEKALTDGFTTGTGLGLGLSGSRRLVDGFQLDSRPGSGTEVTIVKWAR